MQKEKTPGNPKDFRRPSSTNRDRYGLDLARARPFDAKSGIFQRIRAPIANPPGLESQKNLPSPQYLPLFPERSNRGLNIYAEGRKRRNLDLGSGLRKMRVEGTERDGRSEVVYHGGEIRAVETSARERTTFSAVARDHAAGNRLKAAREIGLGLDRPSATAKNRERTTRSVSLAVSLSLPFFGLLTGSVASGPIGLSQVQM
jgi:hypothetical protein